MNLIQNIPLIQNFWKVTNVTRWDRQKILMVTLISQKECTFILCHFQPRVAWKIAAPATSWFPTWWTTWKSRLTRKSKRVSSSCSHRRRQSKHHKFRQRQETAGIVEKSFSGMGSITKFRTFYTWLAFWWKSRFRNKGPLAPTALRASAARSSYKG